MPMKNCLILDDSRVARKVARRILEDLQFGVEEAEDGREGLEICRRKMPDAILLDCGIQGMSGVEFLRVLRREPSGGAPIVVFCTIENDISLITEAVTAGASDYILKPFDRDILKAAFTEAGLLN
jgi:two-component system, chemotaxis family, chemotaxis protein CheY